MSANAAVCVRINKHIKEEASIVLDAMGLTVLVKVFQSSGEPVTADDNPFPVSAEKLIAKAGDVSWIHPEFLRLLAM